MPKENAADAGNLKQIQKTPDIHVAGQAAFERTRFKLERSDERPGIFPPATNGAGPASGSFHFHSLFCTGVHQVLPWCRVNLYWPVASTAPCKCLHAVRSFSHLDLTPSKIQERNRVSGCANVVTM